MRRHWPGRGLSCCPRIYTDAHAGDAHSSVDRHAAYGRFRPHRIGAPVSGKATMTPIGAATAHALCTHKRSRDGGVRPFSFFGAGGGWEWAASRLVLRLLQRSGRTAVVGGTKAWAAETGSSSSRSTRLHARPSRCCCLCCILFRAAC